MCALPYVERLAVPSLWPIPPTMIPTWGTGAVSMWRGRSQSAVLTRPLVMRRVYGFTLLAAQAPCCTAPAPS